MFPIFLTATEFISESVYTEAPALTEDAASFSDLAGNAASLASDFVDKYLSMDFINDLLSNNFVKIFAVGFAFTSLLILLTYGVFKAFSLVRIDS